MTEEQLQRRFETIEQRLDAQSLYILNELMPVLEKVRGDHQRLWVSNDRFTELERAVADVAMALLDKRTGKADSRVRED